MNYQNTINGMEEKELAFGQLDEVSGGGCDLIHLASCGVKVKNRNDIETASCSLVYLANSAADKGIMEPIGAAGCDLEKSVDF